MLPSFSPSAFVLISCFPQAITSHVRSHPNRRSPGEPDVWSAASRSRRDGRRAFSRARHHRDAHGSHHSSGRKRHVRPSLQGKQSLRTSPQERPQLLREGLPPDGRARSHQRARSSRQPADDLQPQYVAFSSPLFYHLVIELTIRGACSALEDILGRPLNELQKKPTAPVSSLRQSEMEELISLNERAGAREIRLVPRELGEVRVEAAHLLRAVSFSAKFLKRLSKSSLSPGSLS